MKMQAPSSSDIQLEVKVNGQSPVVVDEGSSSHLVLASAPPSLHLIMSRNQQPGINNNVQSDVAINLKVSPDANSADDEEEDDEDEDSGEKQLQSEAERVFQDGGKWAFFKVCLTCMGVVYGDIGTSPIYTFGSCVADLLNYQDTLLEEDIVGITSMLFWALTLVPTLKYCVWVLSATAQGQGGTFALLALLTSPEVKNKYPRGLLLLLVPTSLAAIALLIGDGVITPAISVISAIEGIQSQAPSVTRDQIVGISIAILGVLYICQRWGTSRIGGFFGPFVFLWFLVIGALGAYYLTFAPRIFKAVSPHYAVEYFVRNGGVSYSVLGLVILVITGTEAMYADMGQFGAGAVRWSWVLLAYPCLLLQYLGQGAMILHNLDDQDSAQNIFFSSVPTSVFWPVFVITTIATIIASQATITGVQVIITQAIHLGYFPPVAIVHQSEQWWARVYLPLINFCLGVATLSLCAAFRSSANLTLMYGLTISMIMVVTTLMLGLVMFYVWKWSAVFAITWTIFFAFFDCLWLGATLEKVQTGGWLPLCFSVVVASILFIFHAGSERALRSESKVVDTVLRELNKYAESDHHGHTDHDQQKLLPAPVIPHSITGSSSLKASTFKAQAQAAMLPLIRLRRSNEFVIAREPRPVRGGGGGAGGDADGAKLEEDKALVAPSRALSVFFTPAIGVVPLALLQMINSVNVFPAEILLLQVEFLEVPYASEEQRVALVSPPEPWQEEATWLHAAVIRVGFAEQGKLAIPSLVEQRVLPLLQQQQPDFPPPAEPARFRLQYYLSNRFFWIPRRRHHVLERLWLSVYDFLHRNSHRLSSFFHLSPNHTVEIGTRIPL